MSMDQVMVEHLGIGAEPRLVDRGRFEKLMEAKGWTLAPDPEPLPVGVSSITYTEDELGPPDPDDSV